METEKVIDSLINALQAAKDGRDEDDLLYVEAMSNARLLKARKIVDIHYFPDEQAEKIGAALAEEFLLKRSREHPDRFETMGGTFRNKGIARRAALIIEESFNS